MGKTRKPLKICDLVNAALGKLSNLWKTFVLTGLKKYEKPCIAKQEISSLIVVANKLELDLSSANGETIKLKKADVPDLQGLRAFSFFHRPLGKRWRNLPSTPVKKARKP